MILRDVRHTMKQLGAASATQLAAELHLRRAEVDSALEFWVQRGDIRVCGRAAGPACGATCRRCPMANLKRSSFVGASTASSASTRLSRVDRPGRLDAAAGRPVVYEWVRE